MVAFTFALSCDSLSSSCTAHRNCSLQCNIEAYFVWILFRRTALLQHLTKEIQAGKALSWNLYTCAKKLFSLC